MKPEIVQKAQDYLSESGIDAWVVSDFRGSNPVLSQVLGQALPHATRRVIAIVPRSGAPQLLVHAIEAGNFRRESGGHSEVIAYSDRADLERWLRQALKGCRQVAVEYSPGGELPTVSWIDAGTFEWLCQLGVDPVSSADLMQVTLATWSADAQVSHYRAATGVVAARNAGFTFAAAELVAGREPTEWQIQQHIAENLTASGLEFDHPPIVGVNVHSGDPHYNPASEGSAPLRRGDWLLIDLWGRLPGDENVYADITWVGRAAAQPTPEQQSVFDIVKGARDLVVDRVTQAWERGREVMRGCDLDRAARGFITSAGYAGAILHRVGHSLGPGPSVHGIGANLDDMENRDTRLLSPGSGFTVEPGIYLDTFGVRLEIDMFVDPECGPVVTTPLQEEILCLVD
ncbi:MAG: M24 family metallopeptidase [Candidatus Latescibacterota bacterium]|nr:M24 family metallopeptidase [Candidatus Latescibacterota bacterium]